MHIYLITVILALIAGAAPAGSEEKWEHFTTIGFTNDVFVSDSTLCAASQYGVILWNTVAGGYRFYSNQNSPLGTYVFTIVSDRNGVVWCRTSKGVFSFDGARWESHGAADGLPDANLINNIILDKQGFPCIYTLKGLFRFIGKTCEVSLPDTAVYWASVDGRGNLWAQTGTAFYRFNGTIPESLPVPDFWVSDRAAPLSQLKCWFCETQIFTDVRGNIWIGGSKREGMNSTYGLIEFDGSSWQFHPLPKGIYYFISGSGDGNTIWAIGNNDIFFFDGEQWNVFPASADIIHKEIQKITTYKNGMIWFATKYGIYRFDGTAWKKFVPDESAVGYGINAMLSDNGGVKWFATDQGVSRYDGKSWKTYATGDGFAGNTATCLMQNTDGSIWCGTENGISRFDGEKWSSYTISDGPAGNRVTGLTRNAKGVVWCGTWGGGIFRFERDAWTPFTTEQGLAGNNVGTMVTDREGNIWAVTNGGLCRFDGSRWKTMNPDPGYVLADSYGTIWYASSSGVFRYNGKTLALYSSPRWEGTDLIRGFIIDGGGAVWVAVFYRGVFRLKDSVWDFYSASNYQLFREINCIAIDERGVIWVGTPWGIMQYNGISWKKIDAVDGVKGFFCDRDGSVWISSSFLSHYTLSTAVEETPPAVFHLGANYPNPFNLSTTISFSLPKPEKSELVIYSATGQHVRTIFSGPLAAGSHSMIWDGRDDHGKTVSSGLYFSRLTAGEYIATGKMLLVK